MTAAGHPLTPLEAAWRQRLVDVALLASHDNLPVIEQGILAIIAGMEKRSRQRAMASVFRHLAELLDAEVADRDVDPP